MTKAEREVAAEALADRAIEVVRRLLDGSAHIEIEARPYCASMGTGRPDDKPKFATTRIRIVCEDEADG